jgi:hypothetical protein
MANRIAPALTLLSHADWVLWPSDLPDGATPGQVWEKATAEVQALVGAARELHRVAASCPCMVARVREMHPVTGHARGCRIARALARLARASLWPPSTVEGKHKLRANSGRNRR